MSRATQDLPFACPAILWISGLSNSILRAISFFLVFTKFPGTCVLNLSHVRLVLGNGLPAGLLQMKRRLTAPGTRHVDGRIGTH